MTSDTKIPDTIPINDADGLPPPGTHRWITAIQKVSPQSGSFWFDYGQRYNEKITIEISPTRDPQGRKCCNIMVFSCRTVGDVVLSAWNEYNRYIVSNRGK